MGFERFGYVSFTSQSKVNGFIDKLEEGKLVGSKCKRCGSIYFPPRADCANCLGNEMDWHEINGDGKIVSFTKLSYAPVGFEDKLPYILALVEFGGVKAFGHLSKEINESEIEVGMSVKPSIVNLPDGQLCYEFVK
ncbi:MAG TPA: Zn-ribbon domain-containing OB-fold protein [Clostridia bacterium]|nr:Zn-ribbon domain-containing OB-fold protein [Clostridia bacterium]